MVLTQSNETYLKTVYLLSEEYEYVRSVDVANHLGYKKSSVSVAIAQLKELGLVITNDFGTLELTSEGKKTAKKLAEKTTVIKDFLVSIGVKDAQALKDASSVDFYLSDATIKAMKAKLK